ncbi:MAG TPA: ATP-binding cassette domain-containing protein [Dictyobacter sp.]|jgi:zinc/manganese transport system ATP-binding protein|nr:ATP-binding cassette domain-containing protein [Dictyobacter sp.]
MSTQGQNDEHLITGELEDSEAQTQIAAYDLGIRLGGHTIWEHAHFSIDEGEFITIVGPNGAGKSTLLRILLGLLPASQGSVQIFGRPPHRGNVVIGYVPQRRTLDPELSVHARDFVMLGVDGHKWGMPIPFVSRRNDQQRVDEALEAVGATAYAHRAVGKLSGGEQQRLLLAQALLVQPKILLLDEPFASLDIRNVHAIAQLISDIARARNITVLLVTHDLNPLLSYTDRILYVARGQVAIGKPDEIITTENLTRLYDAPVEVMRDSRGRILVFGLENTNINPTDL